MIPRKLLLMCTICGRLLITTTTTTAVEAEQEPSTPAMVTTTTVLLTTTPAAATAAVWGRGRGSPCWATATRSTAWCCPATRRPSGQAIMLIITRGIIRLLSPGRRAAGATAGGGRSRGTTDTTRGDTGPQLIVNTTNLTTAT